MTISTSSRGGRRQSLPQRWDLIPFEALRAISAALTEGEIKYGRWDEDPREPNYMGLELASDQSPLSHALHHLAQWQRGDVTEDHLASAAANLCILLKHRDNPDSPYYGKTYPEILAGGSTGSQVDDGVDDLFEFESLQDESV